MPARPPSPDRSASERPDPRGPAGPRIGPRPVLLLGLLGALVLQWLPQPAAAQYGADADFPRRSPGLWEIRSAGSSANGMPPTLNCIGERTDTEQSQLGRHAGAKGACTLGAFKRVGESWVAESVCKMGKTSVTSQAIASGDFQSQYRIDTMVTYDPPLGGVKKEDKEAVVARYLGPCLAHQHPGDVVFPGMGTLNMTDGTFRAEPAAAAARPAGRKKTSERTH